MRRERTVLAVGPAIAILAAATWVTALAADPAASPVPGTDMPSGTALDDDVSVVVEWFQPGKDTKDLFLADLDGSDQRVILGDQPGERRVPDWSPDGSRIAFVTRDVVTPDGSIWTAEGDGSNAERLFHPGSDCPWGAYHPAWSPDGQRLAIVCYPGEDGVSSLALVDLGTLELTTLASVEWPEFLDTAAGWSPDGSTLVFGILHWDPTDTFIDGSLLATVPVSGGDATRLSDFESFDAAPDWHPTDDLIAFNSYELGNIHETSEPSNIYTMRSDGSERRQLTTVSTGGGLRVAQPKWSPEGDKLVATLARGNPVVTVEVAFVDARTGDVTSPTKWIPGAHPDIRPVVDADRTP